MNVDKIERIAVDLAKDIYAKQIIKWIKELKSIKGKDFAKIDISKFNISKIDKAFEKLVFESMLLAYLQGRAEAKFEIEKSKGKEFAEDEISPALKAFKKKIIMSGSEFKRINDKYKGIAATVANIENMNAQIVINKSLENAIKKRLGFKDWEKTLPDLYKHYGITPLSDHHLKVVFRTNVGQARNQGHWDEAQKDDWVVAFQYNGTLDNVISEVCRGYHGKIYPKDDPVWNTIRPLNHHLCRCMLQNVSKYDVKKDKIEYSKPLTEEEKNRVKGGFKHMPRNLSEQAKKLKDLLERKRGIVNNLVKKYRILNKTPESIKSVKGLEIWAKAHDLAKNEINFDGLKSVEAARDVVSELKSLKDKYGVRFNNVGIKNSKATSKGIWTMASKYEAPLAGEKIYNTSLYINQGYIDYNGGYKNMKEAITQGSKPQPPYTKRWRVAKNYKGIVDHEFGHLITTGYSLYNHKAIKRLYKGIKFGLSRYGDTSIRETLAEMFVAYEQGERNFPQDLVDLFKECSIIKLRGI